MSQLIARPLADTQNRTHQRGMATIVTSVILLLVASIAVLYLNRSLIFEQRTSANYIRSATAQEMAEAGIEWAAGMLNSATDIDTSCNALSTALSPFSKKYVFTQWGVNSHVVSATTTYPGCKFNDTTYTCGCPDVTPGSTTVASLGTSVLPGFTVQFSDVANDTLSVKITAIGCTATSYACTSSNASASDGPDARATVTVILKAVPLLRSAPASALTCGGSCTVGGSYNIINTNVASNGVLVNSGSSISSGNGVGYTTLPGMPYQNAVIANDPSLSSLTSVDTTCSNSKLFSAYFGSTVSQYISSNKVKTLSCTSASSCATVVNAAYDAGWRSFYFDNGFYWNNSSGNLGTPSDPVTIVTSNTFSINGNISIYGMVFTNDPTTADFGTGTANVYGGIITCGAYNSNGNGTLQYDAATLGNVQTSTASWVKVPGSWRDW